MSGFVQIVVKALSEPSSATCRRSFRGCRRANFLECTKPDQHEKSLNCDERVCKARPHRKRRVMDRPLDVAVVVPTRNSATTLRACLESLRAQTHPCEIIVVDNSSIDETAVIAQDLADHVLTRGPERSAQRNAGAAFTSAPIIGFIDSDMVVSATVIAEVIIAIAQGAASVVIPERTVGEGYWAKVSAFERSFYLDDQFVEAPRFFPAEVFHRVGGFDEAMTGAEDWDLGLRTASLGTRTRTNAEIVHEEGRVRFFNICMKKAYYAPGVALFVKKHGVGTMREMASRRWLRQPRALANALGVGLVALKMGQALAMVGGLAAQSIGHGSKLPRRPDTTQSHWRVGN
jgi:GT2 family glycosyltransferase